MEQVADVVHTPLVLPGPARAAGSDLLTRLDHAVRGRIEAFYVVGSASMGAFRTGRSDLDFVAVVDGDLRPAELMRLRRVHLGRWVSALTHDVALRGRWPLVCNGVYVRSGDLARSPLEITPLAGCVAGRFRTGTHEGFDINPVTWKVLARHSVALRGPDRARLQVHTDDRELRAWVRGNLNGYWRRWAERTRNAGGRAGLVLPRRRAAWGVLGAPRLHYTLTTGEITTKVAAANYALGVFEQRWRPLIDDAVAYWHHDPASETYRRRPLRRLRDAADFVDYVIDTANAARTTSLPTCAKGDPVHERTDDT